jgi:hypothetical protein
MDSLSYLRSNSLLGMPSSIMDTSKVQNLFKSHLGGLHALIEQSKSMQERLGSYNNLRALTEKLKKVDFVTNAALGDYTSALAHFKYNNNLIDSQSLNKLYNIQQQYSDIFGKINRISAYGINQHKLFALHSALGGLSARLAAYSLVYEKPDVLDDIEEISTQVASVVGQVEVQNFATQEDLKRLEALFETLAAKSKFWPDKLLNIIVSIIGVIGSVLTINAEFPKLLPTISETAPTYTPENLITKEYIDSINKVMYDSISKFLPVHQDVQIVKHKTRVWFKPRTKSYILGVLEKGMEVKVIQRSQEWVNIMYVDPKDNLPVYGWIRKKYLKK